MIFIINDIAKTRDVSGKNIPISDKGRQKIADKRNAFRQIAIDETVADLLEKKIQDRMELLSRNQAIADLKNRNEI